VFVAFAGTGATPVNNSAGNATKLPPPATAFMAPPIAPAKNKNIVCERCKSAFYHEPQHISSGLFPIQIKNCGGEK
jgi:hypothetical protein